MSSNTKARFGLEYHADSKVITFHVRTQLSQVPTATFTRKFKDDNYEQLGSVGQQLISELFGVDGVIEVTLRTYDVTIRIAQMFEFEDRDDLLTHLKWIIGKAAGLQPEDQPVIFKPFVSEGDDVDNNY